MPAAAALTTKSESPPEALSGDQESTGLRLSVSVESIVGLMSSRATFLELDLSSIGKEEQSLVVRSEAPGKAEERPSRLGIGQSGWTFNQQQAGDGDEGPKSQWVVNVSMDDTFHTKICLGMLHLRLLDADRDGTVVASGQVPLRSLLHETCALEGHYPLILAAEYLDKASEEEEGPGAEPNSCRDPAELQVEQAPTLDAHVRIGTDNLIGDKKSPSGGTPFPLGDVEDFPEDWR
ncbi:hypothetical protein Pmar_PMAR013330, partial [Perkinsus marinus ATCC 50983]